MAHAMSSGPAHPVSGILIAIVASLALVVVGVDIALVAGVLIIWVGSLYLVSTRPPDLAPKPNGQAISRENMGALIEHSATPLLVAESGKVVIANRAAQRILGKHIIGQDTRMAFRQPEAVKLLAKNRSGVAIIRGLVRRRDIWRLYQQKVDDDLTVIELINRTAEADISRAHTDFVANASHELRTPLASIIGYVETLREGGEDLDAKTTEKFLDTILREAKRLQNLVSDLMSLSRVEAEKHEQPSKILKIGKLVERAARDAAGAERADRLEIATNHDLRIQGDEQQIEQLVRNLVDNALKYGHADKPVSVVLDETNDNQVRLCVTDQGDGIAPEHLPHLTRRFYRTDPGRSRASGGTGLGLAIVKHIVERHRGRLDIQSKLGEGTTISIRIPKADGEPQKMS